MRSVFFRYRFLIGFTISYLVLAGALYLAQGNWEFLTYLAVVLVGGYLLIHTVEHTRLTRVVLWLISVAGLLHMLCGIVPVGDGILYNWEIVPLVDKGDGLYILKMDQVVHFYGYCVAAVAIHQAVVVRMTPRTHRGVFIFVACTSSIGLGALNEVMEYLATLTYAETEVGRYHNNSLDLVFNFGGALSGSIGENIRWRRCEREDVARNQGR